MPSPFLATHRAGLCLGSFPFSQAADLSKPIDKRIYKGTQPTCHDFNHLTATAESVSLLVGFSAGQVQLIDPIKKETSKLFNEEVCLGFPTDVPVTVVQRCACDGMCFIVCVSLHEMLFVSRYLGNDAVVSMCSVQVPHLHIVYVGISVTD